MIIYIAGLQGVGKTFFGKKLADHVQAPFFDVDATFLEVEGGTHTSVRDLFTTLGVEHYRKKEEKIVREISLRGNCIVALGGGSLDSTLSQHLVAATGVVVYLFVGKERLKEQLSKKMAQGFIPLYLDKKDPLLSFEQLFDNRHAILSKCAEHIIELEVMNNDEVLTSLKMLWQEGMGGK